MTRKWNTVNDQSNANYDVGNEIIYNTGVLTSNLWGFNDAYILARAGIVIIAYSNPTPVTFKNCASFIKWITEMDGATIDDAEDLELVMSMYNLIEYKSSYSRTTESLWFYSKDKTINFNPDIANNNVQLFEYKAKLLGNTEAYGRNRILKNAAIAMPFKCLCNFWRSLEMPLINCKVERKYKCRKYCILSPAGVDNVNANSNNIMFSIKDIKLYFLLSLYQQKIIKNYQNVLKKDLKDQFIENKYKIKSENKNMTNEFTYFPESNFVWVNTLFVLVYSDQDDRVNRFKTQRYYLPKWIIKSYSIITNGKNFYHQAIDSDTKQHEKIRQLTTGQGEDCTSGCVRLWNVSKLTIN